MKQKISSIECVTAVGNGHCYAVGNKGVIKIERNMEQIGEYEFINYYEVWTNDGIIAKVDIRCPVVVTYD